MIVVVTRAQLAYRDRLKWIRGNPGEAITGRMLTKGFLQAVGGGLGVVRSVVLR